MKEVIIGSGKYWGLGLEYDKLIWSGELPAFYSFWNWLQDKNIILFN